MTMPIMLAGTERRVFLASSPSVAAASRLLRAEVAYEAIRLTRTLAALQPGEPEVHGLLALCELTAARFPARTGPDGFAGLMLLPIGMSARDENGVGG